jgi:hypothetical protein
MFDSFELQTSNYIVSNIEYRTIPTREIALESISRRSGKKMLSTDFGERKIKMSGFVLGTSASNLQTNIDTFHLNVTRKTSGTLAFDATRSITATISTVAISDPQYSQTMVPFEIEFIAASPFYEGVQQTANTTVATGTGIKTITTTISGSVYAEPSITFTATAGSGDTTTKSIGILYSPTAEQTTWSGSVVLPKGSAIQFDNANYRILNNTTEVAPIGSFPRWEPGSTTFYIYFYGGTQGGTVALTYYPRFL